MQCFTSCAVHLPVCAWDTSDVSAIHKLLTLESAAAHLPRSISMSYVCSKISSCGAVEKLDARAAELKKKAAIKKAGNRKEKVVVQGGCLEIEEDEYLEPPAWKQFFRKMRAQAKKNVHAAPAKYYSLQSYEKNFDNGGEGSWNHCNDEDDELEVRQRALHTALLTKFHSTKDENLDLGLLRTKSVPVHVRLGPKEVCLPIWQRRGAGPPLTLEIITSL